MGYKSVDSGKEAWIETTRLMGFWALFLQYGYVMTKGIGMSQEEQNIDLLVTGYII